LTPPYFKEPSVHRPQVEQIDRRISLWIHEKADTNIARAARKLWKRGFFWKDIPKQRFTAFRPRNARSYAEPMPRVQMVAEKNGLRWRFWRIRFYDQLGGKVQKTERRDS
jgi:hypothetical protein